MNTHTHLELTGLRGTIREPTFPAWISSVREEKADIDERGFLAAARAGLREVWRFGTTTVADTGTSGAAARALSDMGGRGIYFHEAIAPEPERADEVLRQVILEIEALRMEASDAVRIGVSPHAPFTVSPALYHGVIRYARTEGLRMAAHVAESHAESEFLTESRGPFADAWRARGIGVPGPARSPVDYLDRIGLLGTDLLAIHAVQVDQRDARTLADRGVCIASCPRSNSLHGHGEAPLERFLDLGISCGFGTDSVVSVDSLDLLADARAARDSGVSDLGLLRLLTLGGAETLGLGPEVGSIEPGKWADLVLLDVPVSGKMNQEQLATAVLDTGSEGISRTYLAGKPVHGVSEAEWNC